MTLGNKIQEIRKNNNLTQEEFAQKFYVTRQTVSNWENNKNYPDMSSLKMISDTYGISFDELLKKDEQYIQSVDSIKKKMSSLKKALIILTVLPLILIISFLFVLHNAFQPTPDGKRINSDTDIKMLMNLPNATLSRAITYTIANTEKDFSKKIEKYKREVLGGVEGDIPHIILNDSAYLTLHFQDLQYIDISPNEIRSVSCELVDVTSIDQNIVKHSLEHSYEAGNISIKLKPEMFPANDSGEVWYKMVITTEYGYKGKVYTGITAVIVLDK